MKLHNGATERCASCCPCGAVLAFSCSGVLRSFLWQVELLMCSRFALLVRVKLLRVVYVE